MGAKLITKWAAVEKNQITDIIKLQNGISIDFKSGNGTFLEDTSYYDSIIQWWRSSCEVDLVLNEPKYYCNTCCCNKCCHKYCNN